MPVIYLIAIFILSSVAQISFAESVINPVKFYPVNEKFNLFLGPDNKIILQSKYSNGSCDELNSFQQDLIYWRNKVQGSQNGQSHNCQCGRQNISEDIQEFFIGKELREQNISSWQMLKKKRAVDDVISHCYLDISNALPERAKELALRQMLVDSNPFADPFFIMDGVNCYNTGLFVNGLINAERYIDDYELDKILVDPICHEISGKPKPGDLVSYYYRNYPKTHSIYKNGDFVTVETGYGPIGNPIHLATYVSDGLLFDTKGLNKDTPFQLSSEQYTEQVYSHSEKQLVKKHFRCLTSTELKEKVNEFPEIANLWEGIDEIEKCYQGVFKNNDLSFEAIDRLRNDVLMAMAHDLDLMINERRTYDEESMTYKVNDGRQEEVVLLKILYNKAHTMIDDQYGRSIR